MRMKRKLTVTLLSAMMALSMAGPANVGAASKKLSVNRVYENATRIKGKTKGKYTVKVKINGKTYKSKAKSNGKFSVKIPRVNVGKKYMVKAYKGKKYYTKKTVYVIAKKLKLNKFMADSKIITGYTRPSYKVKVTINKKTYTVKASKNSGYFKVKLSKKAGSGNATIKVYNTKGKSFTSQTAKHTHVWKDEYKTVHHDAVGHYETVTVPAWDEQKPETHWICYGCGLDLDVEYEKYKKNWPEHLKEYPDDDFCENIDEFCGAHSYILGTGCHSSWYSKTVYVTIHHEATTKQQWVVDKKAYDEKIPTGHKKCVCGATK